jgi:peptidoglycan/xylan/chitin deacetylase (PgdA/CDA1 family)
MHSATHSIMFHHFYDQTHPRGQGAISSSEFEDMIDWLSERYSLIQADEYQFRAENGRLQHTDICLSFDDALLCQYDIAVPVMKRRGIRAFFFVYSSPFGAEPDYLEVFRYFRTVAYDSLDKFYGDFFQLAERSDPDGVEVAKSQYNSKEYLAAFPYYSENDKRFRYLRDKVLGAPKYHELMLSLMREKAFDIEQIRHKLWMTNDHLKHLKNDGHTLGLHSYSHPTTIHTLNVKEQEEEYRKNQSHLSELLGKEITAMSHPCGNYGPETLKILNNMGVKIGFRSSMSTTDIRSNLEIPREDHANVLKEMIA